ncbi:MAG: DUF1579 family protein [Gemmata sp.]
MLRPVLLLALASLVAGAATGRVPQPDDKKDPQARFEPNSKPGEGQKFLEKFVGDWDVAKAFHPRGGGEPAKSTGTCRQTMVHGGRFLQSDFTFGAGDAQTSGTGLIGFEPETGKFTSTWIDSRQTRMSFRQGADKFDGKKIVLLGQALGEGPKDGARRSQTATTLEDGGKKIVHRQHAIEPDGTARLVMELVLTRKADAPKPPE